MVCACDSIDLEGLEVVEIDQTTIAMVGGQVEMSQKVCSENWLSDVCNNKIEPEYLISQGNVVFGFSVTGYGGAIGC